MLQSNLFSPVTECSDFSGATALRLMRELIILKEDAAKYENELIYSINTTIVQLLQEYYAKKSLSVEAQQFLTSNFDEVALEPAGCSECCGVRCNMREATLRFAPGTAGGLLAKLITFHSELGVLFSGYCARSIRKRRLLFRLGTIITALRKDVGELLLKYNRIVAHTEKVARSLALLNRGRVRGEEEGKKQQQRGAMSGIEVAAAGAFLMSNVP